MADVAIRATRLGGSQGVGDLLLVGPSLGTSVAALWSEAAALLGTHLEVVGWDLPGHGLSPAPEEPFTIDDLADAVRRLADQLAGPGRRVFYAGVSIGGAVGLALGLDPGPVAGVVVLASAARIVASDGWPSRAALVRRAGTPVMVEASARRWFAPGFPERHPERVARLVASLHDADAAGYAGACEALEDFDLRDRLGSAVVPVLLLPGEHDGVVTVEVARETAALLPSSAVRVMTGCGHLPPAEDPYQVAEAITEFVTTTGGRG